MLRQNSEENQAYNYSSYNNQELTKKQMRQINHKISSQSQYFQSENVQNTILQNQFILSNQEIENQINKLPRKLHSDTNTQYNQKEENQFQQQNLPIIDQQQNENREIYVETSSNKEFGQNLEQNQLSNQFSLSKIININTQSDSQNTFIIKTEDTEEQLTAYLQKQSIHLQKNIVNRDVAEVQGGYKELEVGEEIKDEIKEIFVEYSLNKEFGLNQVQNQLSNHFSGSKSLNIETQRDRQITSITDTEVTQEQFSAYLQNKSYYLQGKIGKGGEAQVYKGYQIQETGEKLQVIFRVIKFKDKKKKQKILEEYQLISSVKDSQNIIKYLGLEIIEVTINRGV